MEPALKSKTAFLDIKWEVVDVESAGCNHLDGLVVLHQSIMSNIDVRNVWRLPHIYAAGLGSEMTTVSWRNADLVHV